MQTRADDLGKMTVLDESGTKVELGTLWRDQAIVLERFIEVGAREVDRQPLFVRDDHQLERLVVHREPVIAESDRLAAAFK